MAEPTEVCGSAAVVRHEGVRSVRSTGTSCISNRWYRTPGQLTEIILHTARRARGSTGQSARAINRRADTTLERRCCVSTVSAQELREVEIIIDGSCLGNPGPGGWACILRCGEHERVLQGGVPDATNNRMELAAAIEGLRALKRACQVTVLTDSEYVRRGITEFLPRWRSNAWRNASGRRLPTRTFGSNSKQLVGYHAVTWVHVRGHSGQPDHERCDALAISAARAARRATATA